jgi:chorismate synthase
MLRWLTAGESHGPLLVGVLEGLPAGVRVTTVDVGAALARRRLGYGRGARMKFEQDDVRIVGGVRHGETLGGPVAIEVGNTEWPKWETVMAADPVDPDLLAAQARNAPLTRPRPGHADLAGAIKYGLDDIRDVLERASARETAARVAAGSLARQLLGQFGVRVASHVSAIGPVTAPEHAVTFAEAAALADDDPLRCVDANTQQRMIAAIDAAREAGDTLGGAFEVIVTGLPPGLGSYVQWDRKLDGRLGQAMMCIHAIKAVGIGIGPEVAFRPGSRVHDEILPANGQAKPPVRPTNNAGGLEGGVTNGEDVRVTGFMKPIATLMQPLRSVDLTTLKDAPAAIERSDVCAVPAAAVVGEAMIAFVLADAFLEKFGGDSIEEIGRHYAATAEHVRRRFLATTPVGQAG